MPVQALYVDPENGPYVDLLGAENCWGKDRDAKTYAGPWPVVAHPPCGPWGRLKALCKYQDPDCGPRAVEQVRAFGGVLEHPEDSALWRHCNLPRPGELSFDGLFTIEVDQCWWGHKARKRTWLLFGGVDRASLPPYPAKRAPTHCVDDGAARAAGRPPRLPRMPHREVHLTPPDFAQWLLDAVGHVPDPRPTHVVDTGPHHKGKGTGGKYLPKSESHLTPPAFARWLVQAVGG